MRKLLPTAFAALMMSGSALAAEPWTLPEEEPASHEAEVISLGYSFAGFDADKTTVIAETVQQKFVAPIMQAFDRPYDAVDFQFSIADIDGDGAREVLVRLVDRANCDAETGCRTYIFQKNLTNDEWKPIFHLKADVLAYRQGDGSREASVAAMMGDGTVSYFTLTGARMYPEQDGVMLAQEELRSKGYENVAARRIHAEPAFLGVYNEFLRRAALLSPSAVDPTGRFHFVDLDQDGMSEFLLESRNDDGTARMIIMKRGDQGWDIAKEVPTFELGLVSTTSGGKAYGLAPVKPADEFGSRPRI